MGQTMMTELCSKAYKEFVYWTTMSEYYSWQVYVGIHRHVYLYGFLISVAVVDNVVIM